MILDGRSAMTSLNRIHAGIVKFVIAGRLLDTRMRNASRFAYLK